MRENLSYGSQETFFFWAENCLNCLEAREVCDYLVTTCHATPESNDDGDGIENSKRAIGVD